MSNPFALSGYSETREFIAQRSHRGEYQTFTLALPIAVLTTLVPTPDPNNRAEDNRVVNEAHAREFGRYWRSNKMWITPPILLDTALDLNTGYAEIGTAGSLTVGKIELPYDSDRQLRILDGQHRILGWTLITKTIGDELAKARDSLLESQRLENLDSVQVDQATVARLDDERRRLRDEHITVEILVGVTAEQHRKFFVDIAVNAKGISKSRTASFNQERMMSRLGLYVADTHALLKGRVDEERDRVGGTSDELISLKNAIELCRESTWGVPSRWTDNREKLNSEEKLKALSLLFIDALCEGSATLSQVRDGDLSPAWLRQNSMLGSTSMLRILAGVHAATAIVGASENSPGIDPHGRERFIGLLKSLDGTFMYERTEGGELALRSNWSDFPATAKFFADAGAKAPSGRPQAMKEFVALLASWAESGRVFTSSTGEGE